MVLNRVANQFCGGAFVRLFQNSLSIRTNCCDRQMQLIGNLAHGPAGGDHSQNLELAIREQFVDRNASMFAKLSR